MISQTAKASIVSLLAANAAGQFRVVGYQDDVVDQTEVEGLKRLVQVYVSKGSFPKSGGSTRGRVRHDLTAKIEMTAAAVNTADMSVLDNPASTALDIQAALAAGMEAQQNADNLIDDLYDKVWKILKGPSGTDLGLPGVVSNVWVDDFDKGDTDSRGEVVLISGTLTLTFSVVETPPALVPVAGAGITTTLNLTADPTGTNLDSAQQGVRVGT